MIEQLHTLIDPLGVQRTIFIFVQVDCRETLINEVKLKLNNIF
jgi:hypothetical protein